VSNVTPIGDAKKPRQPPPEEPGERAQVLVTTKEHEVTSGALAAIAGHPSLYQRGGMLVQPVRDARAKGNVSRPDGVSYISEVASARLREMVSERVFLCRMTAEDGPKPCHVPDWLVKQISGRKQWDGIRPLEALSETPVLRADGSVLSMPGYDAATGVLYQPTREFPAIKAAPTVEHAKLAIAFLLEPFADFPFAEPCHRSAVLAGILTPLARFAFQGPSPLILITKNVRGAGGSLLADAISMAATGRGMARMTQAGDDDEERKRILSIALAGDRMVLVDNVDHPLGGAALDAALTGTEWRDRILGRSEMVTAPLLATWFATGNNPQILGDTVRRILPIRIESPEEKPEERTGFKHHPLEPYVLSQHPRMVAAALTVLRAHAVAGRPRGELKSWGSFDGWSDTVRSALVWAGEVDPAIGREGLAQGSDDEGNALGVLIQHWRHLDSTGTGVSSQNILRAVTDVEGDIATLLRDAIIMLSGKGDMLPSAARMSKRLAHFVGRVVGGKKLIHSDGRANMKLWHVVASK
jgi:hypothetical protein